MADKTIAEHVADVKALATAAADQAKNIATEALAEARAGKALSEGLKTQADEVLTKTAATEAAVADLAVKLARIPGLDGKDAVKGLGETVVSTEEFKSLVASPSQHGKASLQLKATLLTTTTSGGGAVAAGAQRQVLPGIQAMQDRRMTIRDLLTPGRMDSGSLVYVQETGFANNAAPVAEGALKPGSDITLVEKTANARVIAHWFKVSRQALDDIAQLESHIDERLLYGLRLAEENQILNGDGTGQNLSGLIVNASAYAAPITIGSPTRIDMIRLGLLQAALALYPATGVVLNEMDWAGIELTKDTTGRYIIGNPQAVASPTLWGRPVVTTPAIAVDKFLVGAFRMGAQIFDRMQARVEVGFVNDDFIRNLLTILGEERLALAVYRPEAFVYGDFGLVT